MIYGLYLSTAGAQAQSRRQDVVANNIANVDTTGFRRQFLAARRRLDHLGELGAAAPSEPADPRRIGGGVVAAPTYDDLHTQGPMKPSSSPTHLAVAGDGFFRIRRGGEVFLTRNGAFSLDAKGRLTTSDGRGLVLSTKGDPIQVDPNKPLHVSNDGKVVQDNRSLGEIAVVLPANERSVERRGDSLLSYDGRNRAASGRVKQYFLEGSNVEPILEMVDLIGAARAFETNVSMIQLQSDTLGQLIDRVGRPA